MMQSESTRKLLKDPSTTVPALKMVELQRAQWDPLGVDRDIGCATLDHLENRFPGDSALVEKRNEFIFCCRRTFLRTLEDRKPDELEKKKPIPREILVEFFNACNAKMELPETHAILSEHMEKT